ncbi:hypothetical protein B0T25DRAFT_582050 [Lasiosphaeria hispida]|uniref:Mid2 domain-containing protein n=1 Tax=Lasiosphaeria hispida TaxID=260671 RepID=A0AAJ0HDV6_9PEZI|nr:hypothetical protein B0T25DRAFT_582050 [Lasiosphaeria hispida]
MAPTPTITIPVLRGLVARQDVTVTVAPTVPTTTVTVVPDSTNTYNTTTSLGPGAIAGIVIGVVVGLLLLYWLFRSCNKPARAPDSNRQGWYDDGRGDAHAHAHGHRHHHNHHGSRSRSRSHHHRHRSVTPVVLEEKPRRPSATYVVDGRRSRSQRRSRSRSASRGYYVS